jgi:hypothetical protein
LVGPKAGWAEGLGQNRKLKIKACRNSFQI